LAEREGDLSQVAFSHGEIGSVLAIQEQYTEALRHFDESYEVNKSLKAVVAVAYAAIQRSSVLWEIGRYDEARAALEEAYSVAQGPDGSHTALLADIHLIHARLELSLRNFRESKVQSRQAIVLAGTQYMEIGVQARRALGLALARSGGPRAGKLLCRQALDLATQVKDQQLRSGASLAYAEALLESGEAQRALEAALEAQRSLARLGQQDSEWKAWLIAARANRLLGEARTASECASLAYTQLSGLEQRWGPEAYAGYTARPDIQNSRKQLDQVLR
jgi:tetratricopeptide (TPR) repeat protein